jgi:hypothetical protein
MIAYANEYHPVMGEHTFHIPSNKVSVQSSESQIPLVPQILDLARQPCIPTTRIHKPSLPRLPTCLASTYSNGSLPQECQDPPAIRTADKRGIYRNLGITVRTLPFGPPVDLEAWTSSPTHIGMQSRRPSKPPSEAACMMGRLTRAYAHAPSYRGILYAAFEGLEITS